MASIDRTFDRIDARFDSFEARMEARFQSIENELHRINGRITMIGFGFAATQATTTVALIIALAD